jgi:hypothetical protein
MGRTLNRSGNEEIRVVSPTRGLQPLAEALSHRDQLALDLTGLARRRDRICADNFSGAPQHKSVAVMEGRVEI